MPPLPSPPPPPTPGLQAPAAANLPLLPGSDPLILGTYTWALAHSPSLRELVGRLGAAERKAVYRLVPGLDANLGRLLVRPTEAVYEIDVQVPVLAWHRCGDALEPWIATALFLALEAAGGGRYRETRDPHHLVFSPDALRAAFVFQAQVRRELAAADPVRLADLPDGRHLFEAGFPPAATAQGRPQRRALPPEAWAKP